jgi:hypothetical protein
MSVLVDCAECGRVKGPYESFERLHDALKHYNWSVSGDLWVCDLCNGSTDRRQPRHRMGDVA